MNVSPANKELLSYLSMLMTSHHGLHCLCLLFDSLCPSQHFFSYVGMGLPVESLRSKDKCILLKDTTQ